MPDDDQVLNDQAADVELEDETTGQTDDTEVELPDDPEELKAIARQNAQALAEAKREKQRLADEARNQADRIQELSVKAQYHVERVKELEGRLEAGAPDRNGAKGKPEEALDDTDLSKLDLADYLDGADGVVRLGKVLKKTLGLMTTREAEQLAEKKIIERDQLARELGSVGTRYPELNDDNSPLALAAGRIEEQLRKEQPNLTASQRWELAASRAEKLPEVANAKKTRPAGNGNGNADALRGAQQQSGRSSRNPGVVTLSEDDRKSFRAVGLTSEKDMLAAKKSLDRDRRESERSYRTA